MLYSPGIAALIRAPFIHIIAISNDLFFDTVYVPVPNLAFHELTFVEKRSSNLVYCRTWSRHYCNSRLCSPTAHEETLRPF